MRTLIALVVALVIPFFTPDEPGRDEQVHRVVSFNIRYGTADDGPDRWEVRREKVVATMKELDAGVVGVQEAMAFQISELVEALPDYAAVGVHRDDGLLAGEGATVLYDRTRYTVAATGTFWLSDTPEVAGSNTWGAACNRTCTWVRLVDLKTAEAFYVFNTHFDHQGQTARLNSVTLVLDRIARRGSDDPFVLMGDFNAEESNPVVTGLKAGTGGWTLRDSYRVIHPDARAGTYTAFRTESDGGERKIDYVFVGPGIEVVHAEIDRRKIDGRYPSDHFPVWADVRIE